MCHNKFGDDDIEVVKVLPSLVIGTFIQKFGIV